MRSRMMTVRTSPARAAVVAALFLALTPAAAAAELVMRDAAWPSMGPGSEAPHPEPDYVEVEVASGVFPVAPNAASSGAPAGPAANPRTPAVALGFPGVDGTMKDGFLHKPPNPHVAVGPGAGAAGRVVMVTASGVQIWDKSGASLAGPIGLDAFLGTPVPAAFGPKVLFDQHAGRFFIVALEGTTPNPGGTSNLHVAVSTSATPGDLTGDWVKLSGSALTTVDGVGTYMDYPGIGADAGSLVVTGNLFGATTGFRGAKIRVFDKAALLAGSYGFVDLDVSESVTPGSFTIQPAHVFDVTDNGNFYLVSRLGPTVYRLWEVAGAPAAPTLVGNAPRVWSAGYPACCARQAGTPVVLETVSGRVMNAVYRDGHVWLTLSADVDFDGLTEVFWARVATNGGVPNAPAIVDTGAIDGSDGAEWTFMPSIGVNAAGDVTINYTQAQIDQFPEMRYASRAASDPAGFFQASAVAATSPGFYDAFFPFVVDRWGNYSATVVDPDDDATFWIMNEIAQTSGVDVSIWGTFIARLAPVVPDPNPPTPTPTPAPPIAGPVEEAGLVFTGEVHSAAERRGDTPGLRGPQLLTVSPDGTNVYVFSNEFLITFLRDPAGGALTPVGTQSFTANGDQGELRAMAMRPDGAFLYGVNNGSPDTIVGLRRHPTIGFFTEVTVYVPPNNDVLRGTNELAISPDSAHLYVADQSAARGGAVVAFGLDPGTGAMTLIEVEETRRPLAVVVSPDGEHVYAVTADDTIVTFKRNVTTGALTFVTFLQDGTAGVDGLKGARQVRISPDGAHVFTIAPLARSVAIFARDAGTGELTFVDALLGSPFGHPDDLEVSPDGRHVYVSDADVPGVLVFLRDPASGRLVFLGGHREGQSGVGGLTDTRQVALSPDGANLYSTSRSGDTEADGTSKTFFGTIDVANGALVTFIRDVCGSGRVTVDEQCDDGNLVDGDGCSSTCALELCPPAPPAGCRSSTAPGGGQLAIKKGRLKWKWGRGQATTSADFGDPNSSATYALCLYDGAGGTQPLAVLAAPAGGLCAGRPCWRVGSKSVRYYDRGLTPDGIFKMNFKPGADGKAKMDLQTSGEFPLVDLPALPLVPPVAVRLLNTDTAACWGADYSAPATNTAAQFKARSD